MHNFEKLVKNHSCMKLEVLEEYDIYYALFSNCNKNVSSVEET